MAEHPIPPVDYASKDYASFRDDLVAAIPDRIPDWTSRSASDPGIALIELFSYVGDILSFYQDRVANEAFLQTAVQRRSVLSIARMLDYRPSDNVAAQVNITFTLRSDCVNGATIPKRTRVTVASATLSIDEEPIVFETDADLVIPAGVFSGEVTATQGVTVSMERIGTSAGTMDQQFPLRSAPVIEGSVSVFVNETGVEGANVEWVYLPHLIDADQHTRAYSMYTDEFDIVHILFGDNSNGHIPVADAVIYATYRVGGGARGNVGPQTLVELVDPAAPGLDCVSAVINVFAATGGSDAETLDQIRRNAGGGLRALERAVTLEDYETLVRKVPGVALASAEAEIYTNVSIYVVPDTGTAMTTDLQTRINEYLANKIMETVDYTLFNATYVGVNMNVNVYVKPQYAQEAVRQAVLKELKCLFLIENLDFGRDIRLSDVYHAAAGVDGVDYITVTLLVRQDDANQTDKVADVIINDREIAQEGTVTAFAFGGILGT